MLSRPLHLIIPTDYVERRHLPPTPTTIIENTFFPQPDDTDIVCPLKCNEYFENPTLLDKNKIPELRSILRYYKNQISFKVDNDEYSTSSMKKIKTLYDFTLTGNKQKMIDRVKRFFKMNSCIVIIQKNIRGLFVRMAFRLRGPGLFKRSICINQTDFYTLEPLDEIPFDQFLSYSAKTNNGTFVYGFDHRSLLQMMKNSQHKLINPYTRERMNIIRSVNKLVRLNKIIEDSQNPPPPPVPIVMAPRKPAAKSSQPRVPRQTNSNNDTISSTLENSMLSTAVSSLYPNYDMNQTITNIREMRQLPFLERANHLFMEIDQLGNYTQAVWFTQLDRRDYIRYYRCLHDIWSYRAQLSFDMKRKICPLWDPFTNFTSEILGSNQLDNSQLQSLCLRTMEDMVFTGLDREFRVLGTFHVLSALTVVSPVARSNMMWLYESVM